MSKLKKALILKSFFSLDFSLFLVIFYLNKAQIIIKHRFFMI